MFAGIYRGFTGKSGYRDFKFTGITCCLQSLQSFLRKNNNKCREFDATGLLWGFLCNSYRIHPHNPCSNIFPELIIVFPQQFLQNYLCRCCEEFEF